MTFPQVNIRLEQILDYNLPHIVQRGNTLPDEKFEVLGHLDGNIPEVIVPNVENNPWYTQKGGGHFIPPQGWEKAINAASGGKYSIQEITKKGLDYTEVHAFYDPVSDVTHYFLMPTREIR